MVLDSKLPRPLQLRSGNRDAKGSSVLAERLTREWTPEPIAYQEQSRPLLPTVRRATTGSTTVLTRAGRLSARSELRRRDDRRRN